MLAAGLAVASCGGGGSTPHDGGGHDATGTHDSGSPSDHPASFDAGDAHDAVTCGDGATRGVNGATCGCGSDCQSSFCVDGVCCDSACTDTCNACNVQGSMGTCMLVPAGLPPRLASTCPLTDVSGCGTDGTCDGQGACRKYVTGTMCRPGTCDGDAVTGRQVCDGNGRCRAGDVQICTPYTCGTAVNSCLNKCTTSADCGQGHQCVAGGCGPKMNGAKCAGNDECGSSFCVDGVCCAVACTGACVSCALTGLEGICSPIDSGNTDPRGVCKDSGAASCGQTGTCDGFGGCNKYAAQTVCVPQSCAGDRLNTAGTCDGNGACVAPGLMDCAPFTCGQGACNTVCNSDKDCAAGIACVNHSCGKKQIGGACTQTSDCASSFCVDGCCCNEACGGSCRSCGLTSSRGTCTPIAAGSADNRKVCKDQGAPSCGTDGRCDGTGGCSKYRSTTVCAGEACANNVYTGQSMCDGAGQCVAPAAQSCAPFACNGQRCFGACTMSGNCSSPNVCNGNSCGKKLPGTPCSAGAECGSNICAQGVCCVTSCNASCKSCALPASLGVCTNVPTGTTDPKGICPDQGAASCGTNSKCVAGACQRYAAGTKCKDPTCPTGTTTFTGQSTCDGAGACHTPVPGTCAPYTCGTANACQSTCGPGVSCAPNNTCQGTSCGLEPPGGACTNSNQCAAGGICSMREKVCCNSACDGPCQTCTATKGTCTSTPAGNADPSGLCGKSDPTTCGNNGSCNGAGACSKYSSTTQCVAQSCPANMSSGTQLKTCNGAGVCSGGGAPLSCGAYKCKSDGTACNNACQSNNDCVSPNLCLNGQCGQKGPGAICAAGAECQSGFCVGSHCCGTNGCGDCHTCDTGTCMVTTGADCSPDACHPGTCTAGGACATTPVVCTAPDSCHTAGSCDPTTGACVGQGAVANGTTCNDGKSCTTGDACQGGVCAGTVNCPASNSCHTAGTCNAGGSCTNPAKSDGTGCDTDGNACSLEACVSGVCTGTGTVTCPTPDQCHNQGSCNISTGVCTNPAKANGASCDTDGNACTPDMCTAGVCVAGGSVTCAAPDQCHMAGSCNGATGQCTYPTKANGTSCDTDSNACTVEACNSGVCTAQSTVTCPQPDQCHTAGSCNPSTGQCTNPQKGNGTSCDTDGSACTVEVCGGGVCTSQSTVTCPPPDSCHTAGTCDPGSGHCSNPAKGDGASCSTDSNQCTTQACVTGVCTTVSQTTCNNPGQCQSAGTCDPGSGQCVYPPVQDNTGCDDGNMCTIGDTCQGGACSSGPPPADCLVCDPLTGCLI